MRVVFSRIFPTLFLIIDNNGINNGISNFVVQLSVAHQLKHLFAKSFKNVIGFKI